MLRLLKKLKKNGIAVVPSRSKIPEFKGEQLIRLLNTERCHRVDEKMTQTTLESKNPEKGVLIQLLSSVLREYTVQRKYNDNTNIPTVHGTYRDYSNNTWSRNFLCAELDANKRNNLLRMIYRIERTLKHPATAVLLEYADNSIRVSEVYPCKDTPENTVRWIIAHMKKGLTTRQAINLLPANITSLMSDRLKVEGATPIASGTAVSPGCAVGNVALNTAAAKTILDLGKKPVLVVEMTTPEDVEVMKLCSGIVTEFGGISCHAALLARGFGIPCIVGAGGILGAVSSSTHVSMDGCTGKVFAGILETETARTTTKLNDLINVAHTQYGSIDVYANADDAESVKIAIKNGAHGIGLCRTEHMFFGIDRTEQMQAMILADTKSKRAIALTALAEYQVDDFIHILKESDGLPVIIRLLDPPLHEFLPKDQDSPALDVLWEHLKYASKNDMLKRIRTLQEVNPMMGHRGCRLGITMPEVYVMQVQAIVRALEQAGGKAKILIPLVSDVREFVGLKALLLKHIPDGALDGIGAMIETPRAAITADEIAEHADFLSIGSNDLTQLAYGFSRDDIDKFLPDYLSMGILPHDPFNTLDGRGVGRLLSICVTLARSVNPDISIGLCGEHGGEPDSIKMCADLGLSYVSCSVPRIKTAKLASAKAGLDKEE